MQYLIPANTPETPRFCTWIDAFSDQELDYFQDFARSAQQAGCVNGGLCNPLVDNEVRRSRIVWGHNDPEHEWVFERLSNVVAKLNVQNYNFDITGFEEALQFTNYLGEDNGTYDWHQDCGGAGLVRKLSLILQLSDPETYSGGDIEIMTSKQPHKVERKRGLIVVFPSWVVHRVTPVTQGSRQTLVSWISGPRFR
jgi:PKHD-type hydroxylase